MLTIKNPRKGADADTGIVIGSFKLVDAGLCNSCLLYTSDAADE